jgi:hypothetical protein
VDPTPIPGTHETKPLAFLHYGCEAQIRREQQHSGRELS